MSVRLFFAPLAWFIFFLILVYIFPYKGGPADIHPFHEFDAFLNSSSSPKSGFLYHSLFISHRDNKELVFTGTDQANESALKESVYLSWELVQQFMDISQPLPDTPEFEPFRHLDPVTAEWDKHHNRPPKLYAQMPDRIWDKLTKKVWEYEKGFKWGASRQQNINNGWQAPPEEIWTLLTEEELATKV